MSDRKFLGRYTDFTSRYVVYETPHAIETDELDNFEITRKRVFYEDVLLVTMHRSSAVLRALLGICLGLFLVIIAAVVGGTAGWVFGAFALLSAIYGIARFAISETVVTVFGRRSKARIRFPFRPARGHQVFEAVCANVRRAQEELAAEIRAQEPPPVVVDAPELPPAGDSAAPLTTSAPLPEQ
jgi:hypothetical protein